jgi:hypothetical protein
VLALVLTFSIHSTRAEEIRKNMLFIGIRMQCDLFTRGYGDQQSWKAMDVMSCRCTCRISRMRRSVDVRSLPR